MNFSMKFRETTHIFTLKKLLQQRHGRVDDLRLCFNQFTGKDSMHMIKLIHNSVNDKLVVYMSFNLVEINMLAKLLEVTPC
jgi:hypothetical protein